MRRAGQLPRADTSFINSTDARLTFGTGPQETLTRHKPMVAEYLDENYDRVRRSVRVSLSGRKVTDRSHLHLQFFSQYSLLVQSSNYVTKRQSLKLLGEILLDRTNFKVMTRYIANEENLKVMMNLLKDRSKNIQFEAFHVFKVGSSRSPPSSRDGPIVPERVLSLNASSYRSLSQIRRSRHRLKRSSGGTRTSSSRSCAISTTTVTMSNSMCVLTRACLGQAG